MAPASRTYSRRSAAKRKRDTGHTTDTEGTGSVGSDSRKRFKSNGDEWEIGMMDTGVTNPTPTPSKRKALRTYGSASKRRQNSPTPPQQSTSKHVALAPDLSEVFESVTPMESPASTPRKLARRMLARSKTESSLETSPYRSSVLERTPSLPTLPSTPSKDKGNRKETESDFSHNPLLPLSRPSASVTKTYAGKSRSFLITIPASSLGSDPALLPPGLNVSIGDEEDDYLNRESYSSLRARWGVDVSEDDPYPTDQRDSPSKRRSGSGTGTPSGSPSRAGRGGKKMNLPSVPLPPGMMNPLKSITELRSKGENRRFLDEIGYMFEGMDKSAAPGVKRTSALDIVTKLCDAEFARKAKAADFLSRIWDAFTDAGAGQDEDKILDLLLAFLASLIARDGTSLADLAQRSSGSKAESSNQYTSFVDTLFVILASCTNSNTSDLLRLVQAVDGDLIIAGMTKKDRNQLTVIYDVVASKSHLFSRKTQITTPLLIIYTLQRLPYFLIRDHQLSTLLASLRVSLSPLLSGQHHNFAKPRSRSTSKPIFNTSSPVISHLQWRDTIPRISFECIKGHLQLLDAFLLGQWQISDDDDTANGERKGGKFHETSNVLDQAKEEWLIEALIALAVCAEMRIRTRDGSFNSAGECLDLILRILVSQTHSDEGWSQAVLRYSYSSTLILRLIAWAGDTYFSLKEAGGSMRRDIDIKAEAIAVIAAEERDDAVLLEVGRGDEHEEIRWQDRLCLALGLLANLVQAMSEAKDIVRKTRIDPNCPLKTSTCIHCCSCSQSSSGLDILVRLYTQQGDPVGLTPSNRLTMMDKMDKAAVHVEDDKQTRRMLDELSLLGHLAVLFGLLMRDSRKNEEVIVAALPTKTKGESRRTKLSRLVEQARALVSFDAALTKIDEPEEAGQVDSIARDVVMFLTVLRDTAEGM